MNKRIVILKPGGTDQLRLIEELVPTPTPNEVLIRVLACGVALGDSMFRQGLHPGIKFPATPGYDIMGEVEAVGSVSSRFKPGDRVAGFPGAGGYTTYICLPETEVVPVPRHLDPAEVVSTVLNYTTAFQLLTNIAKLKAGDTALIHGAAGGVGTAVVQLAKVLGITIYGTVSTGKMAFVKTQGGIPIDYTKTDFVADLRRLTGNGVDAVFDAIGGVSLSRSYRALKPGGTLVFFGATTSVSGSGNPKLGLFKTLLRFVWLKLRPGSKKVVALLGDPSKGSIYTDMTTMITLLAEGKINSIIAKTFPLSEAAQAQAMLEQDKPIGKIVLLP
jgi:NADPH:quinone reductase-like Zn-dependent oxidoreductase